MVNIKGKCNKTCEQFQFVVKNVQTEKFSTPPTNHSSFKTQAVHTVKPNDYVRTDMAQDFFPYNTHHLVFRRQQAMPRMPKI